jgi:hypothetical protein
MMGGLWAAGMTGLALVLGVATPVHALQSKAFKPESRASSYKADQKIYELDGWRMVIRKDGFTGEVRCRLYTPKTLRRGRITYAQNTFGFQLDKDINTTEAWYRIDGGPARRWKEHFPVLKASRVQTEWGTFENPSGGVVLIPESELLTAREVTIKGSKKSSPKRFQIKGFQAAKAAALYNGCGSEDSFERVTW